MKKITLKSGFIKDDPKVPVVIGLAGADVQFSDGQAGRGLLCLFFRIEGVRKGLEALFADLHGRDPLGHLFALVVHFVVGTHFHLHHRRLEGWLSHVILVKVARQLLHIVDIVAWFGSAWLGFGLLRSAAWLIRRSLQRKKQGLVQALATFVNPYSMRSKIFNTLFRANLRQSYIKVWLLSQFNSLLITKIFK